MLDEAASHYLLRKVGGSYLFMHDLLRDYLASLEVAPAPHFDTSVPSSPESFDTRK
jgi:hypothetical protein